MQPGTVSVRVGFVLRSTEVYPVLFDLLTLLLYNCTVNRKVLSRESYEISNLAAIVPLQLKSMRWAPWKIHAPC
jgi:hypothetical protein